MTTYERTLLAYGLAPDMAKRLAWADSVEYLRNRDHWAYGKYDPAPPSPEEVREAYELKYGPSHAA